MQQEFNGSPMRELEGLFDLLPEVSPINLPSAEWGDVSVDVLRLDKVHPFISGNKWFKLKQHLNAAQAAGKSRLLSFGGAYSNHLHALAYAGKELGIETVGIVRGEAPDQLTPTLQDCVDWGMQLEWLSRRDYRSLAPMTDQDSTYANSHPDAWVIPEGGAGQSGIEGVRELFTDLYHDGRLYHDVLFCPVGTGTTLAGIASAAIPNLRCVGFSALKGADELEHRIEQQLSVREHIGHWEICHDYHFGGFAKLHPRLKDFISDFYDAYGLLLDPVYTGKMLFGMMEWCRQGRFPEKSKLLVVHTGGLQGWRGYGEIWPGISNHE